jgi:ribonucleoside-diphosphate reductase beta chain
VALKKIKILEPENPNKPTAIVNGQASGIVNWNDLKYPHFYDHYKKLLSQFWTPFEINMSKDVIQLARGELDPAEVEAYFLITALLTTFDSIQARWISFAAPYITDTSVAHLLYYICRDEVVHNQSYSYLLASVTDNETQMKTFEHARTHPKILKRNERVLEIYEKFKENPTPRHLAETLVASNCNEGIFFYSGFAYFYHLARNQKMLATSTMIRYIQRDEMLHNRIGSDILRALLGENPEIDADGSFSAFMYDFVKYSVEAEIEWSKYILKDIKNLDLLELEGYLKYLGNKRSRLMGGDIVFEGYEDNPCRWIQIYSDETLDSDKTDFFEQKSRNYTKITDENGFDEL